MRRRAASAVSLSTPAMQPAEAKMLAPHQPAARREGRPGEQQGGWAPEASAAGARSGDGVAGNSAAAAAGARSGDGDVSNSAAAAAGARSGDGVVGDSAAAAAAAARPQASHLCWVWA